MSTAANMEVAVGVLAAVDQNMPFRAKPSVKGTIVHYRG